MPVVLIFLVNGFIGTFSLYQCNNMFILLREVRKYKSCGVFNLFCHFVLTFEHCYFAIECCRFFYQQGKIGPILQDNISRTNYLT